MVSGCGAAGLLRHGVCSPLVATERLQQALRWRLPLAMPAHALLPAEHRLLQRVNLNEKREAQLEKDFYRVLLSN